MFVVRGFRNCNTPGIVIVEVPNFHLKCETTEVHTFFSEKNNFPNFQLKWFLSPKIQLITFFQKKKPVTR